MSESWYRDASLDTGIDGALDGMQPIVSPLDAALAADLSLADFPLQYSALFAECQPTNSSVPPARLERVLARAQLPYELSVAILERAVQPEMGRRVGEQNFFRALAEASAHQSGGSEPAELQLTIQEENGEEEEKYLVGAGEVTVTLLRKDAGSFLLRHAEYKLGGTFGERPVTAIRRYRDFDQLSSLLLVQYPLRAVPLPPVKTLALNGLYLVGDSQDEFLARRAEGLERFLNLIVQHPVLNQDSAVSSFLCSDAPVPPLPPDMGGIELQGRTASPLFVAQWQQTTLTEWHTLAERTASAYAHTAQLCRALERQVRRSVAVECHDLVGLASDARGLASVLDQPAGLESLAQYADSHREVVTDGARQLSKQPLEELRAYRDMLASVLELFKRFRHLAQSNVPALQKRIAGAERRLAALATRENVREEDLHKERTIIQTAQNDIRNTTNHDWLVKMAMAEELRLVQGMQAQLPRVLWSWGKVATESAQRVAEVASIFAESTV